MCAETKELIAGYTFIQVKSREETLEWSKRFPNPGMKDGEIEACQLFELEDFGARRRSSAFASWGSRGEEVIEEIMKYISLGYFDESKWEAMSESEQQAFVDECFAYDDLLRKNGHIVGGEALQSSRNAVTLRWQSGRVSITDGPYAETKEQLGGFGVFEARDLNHAIQLMSKHPAVKSGSIEIRPVDDLSEMIRESERRRSQQK